jgi:AcrR family transcriptional regulator
MMSRKGGGVDTSIKVAGREKMMSSTRERILEGAMQVAIRDGILATTLDAVAREAGISKGGLIHHFRTKDELISAMLEHFPARVLRSLEERMAADPKPSGRFVRALVRTVFPSDTASGEPAEPLSEMFRFLLPVLAAAANNNPELLRPFRQTVRQMRERLLAEGPNGLRQLALWPAIFGLMLWQHVGVIAPDDPVCQSMIAEWLTLAEGASSTPAAPFRYPDSGDGLPQGGQRSRS